MAVLTDTKREAIWDAFMTRESADRKPMLLSKTALRAAVDAIDTWLDNNNAAFDAAIPAAARAALTARQKACLLFNVAEERFGVA